jgi:hypothetical protein
LNQLVKSKYNSVKCGVPLASSIQDRVHLRVYVVHEYVSNLPFHLKHSIVYFISVIEFNNIFFSQKLRDDD